MVRCDDLERWDGEWVGGEFKTEGIYVYIRLIHVVVQQKLTQHCKAIRPQLNFFKIQKKKKKSSRLYVYFSLFFKEILCISLSF